MSALLSSIDARASVDRQLQPLLEAARGGDRDAFARVVALCQNSVTAIALSIVRDVPASEDIAQDAFLSAWLNLKRLQNPASFLPWLRQITRNLARDHLRAGRSRPPAVDDAEAVIAQVADPGPDPCHRVLDGERRAAIEELIAALPDDSREILLLYYREGQRSRHVADLLGLSDAAVRKRLSRARTSVRRDLLERFADLARDTAPSAAFTAVVASALAVASPPAAAFGILGAAAAGGSKTTLAKVVLGAAGSIAFAAVAALTGIWLELRGQLKGALDTTERLALVRSAVVCALASVGFVVAITVVAARDPGWFWPTVMTLVFLGTVFWQSMVVQPRAMRRRHAREAALDPEAAARDRRRERLRTRLGVGLGMVAALGGLFAGLVASGRL